MKKPLHSFGQRVPKCTPNFRLSPKKFFEKIYPFTCSHWEVPIYRVFIKNFLSCKIPLTYLELQVSMTPYFTEKMRNIFYPVTGALFCLHRKSLLTYSHWEQPNAPPKFQKIYPFTYLELRGQNAPCFHEKFEKYFLFGCGRLIFTCIKVLSLI